MEYEGDHDTNCNCGIGIATKGLVKCLEDLEIGGLAENISITTLFSSGRILRWVLEIWEKTYCHSKSDEKLISLENLSENNNNNDNNNKKKNDDNK